MNVCTAWVSVMASELPELPAAFPPEVDVEFEVSAAGGELLLGGVAVVEALFGVVEDVVSF